MSSSKSTSTVRSMARFIAALAIFASCSLLVRRVGFRFHPAWIALIKLALIAGISIALILLSPKPFSSFGFRIPSNVKWFKALGQGLIVGMMAAAGALVLGFTGMAKLMSSWSFLQLILVAWLCSSLVEELFCRSWFQSGLPEGKSRIIWSSALFGSLHLALLTAGVGAPTAVWIVVFASVLGYVCARLRDISSSWLPAFVAHFGFNVGGLISGIAYTIVYKLVTGQLPLRQ